jgi:hypothetical protein
VLSIHAAHNPTERGVGPAVDRRWPTASRCGTERLPGRRHSRPRGPRSPPWGCTGTDVVITIARDGVTLADVVGGQHGIAAGIRLVNAFAEMSTVGRAEASRLTEPDAAGSQDPGGPVLGTLDEAEQGSLTLSLAAPTVLSIVLQHQVVITCRDRHSRARARLRQREEGRSTAIRGSGTDMSMSPARKRVDAQRHAVGGNEPRPGTSQRNEWCNVTESVVALSGEDPRRTRRAPRRRALSRRSKRVPGRRWFRALVREASAARGLPAALPQRGAVPILERLRH